MVVGLLVQIVLVLGAEEQHGGHNHCNQMWTVWLAWGVRWIRIMPANLPRTSTKTTATVAPATIRICTESSYTAKPRIIIKGIYYLVYQYNYEHTNKNKICSPNRINNYQYLIKCLANKIKKYPPNKYSEMLNNHMNSKNKKCMTKYIIALQIWVHGKTFDWFGDHSVINWYFYNFIIILLGLHSDKLVCI